MYIIIKNIDIADMNGDTNQLVANSISPTAVAGFGHALVRKFSEHVDNVTHGGSAVVVHKFEAKAGHPKATVQEEKNKDDAARIVDTIVCAAQISLVIRVDTEAHQSDHPDILERCVDISVRNIGKMRFQGGTIIIEDRLENLVDGCLSDDDLRDSLARLRRGYVLCDRADILRQEHNEEKDPLDIVLEVATLYKERDDNHVPREGWVVPVSVGFQALEMPQDRKTSRFWNQNYKHLFAESLTGLGEYVILRKEMNQVGQPLPRSFWAHHHDDHSQTYYVSCI